jgi:hypothetical protein
MTDTVPSVSPENDSKPTSAKSVEKKKPDSDLQIYVNPLDASTPNSRMELPNGMVITTN